MNARWVLHNPSPEMPTVGYAIVARWWPGRYFLAMAIMLDSSSPLHRLTQSIAQNVPYAEPTPGPARFVTQVFRCDKRGVVFSFDRPLYEKEYSELLVAQEGHKRIVAKLEQGRKL